jgi:hypothetical protein
MAVFTPAGMPVEGLHGTVAHLTSGPSDRVRRRGRPYPLLTGDHDPPAELKGLKPCNDT